MRNEIELFINESYFRDIIKDYEIVDRRDNWTRIRREWDYYIIDHGSYGLLVNADCDPDILEAFGEKLNAVDELRPLVNKPLFRADSIQLYVEGNYLYTSPSLGLEWFFGEDLVNSLTREKGLEIRRAEDGITLLYVKVARPLTPESANKALKKLAFGLRIYERVKEEQEDVALRVTKTLLSSWDE